MGDGLFRRRNAAAGEKDDLNWDDRIYFAHSTKKSGEVAISEIRPTVYHRGGIFDED
jgi:hypothetical protein